MVKRSLTGSRNLSLSLRHASDVDLVDALVAVSVERRHRLRVLLSDSGVARAIHERDCRICADALLDWEWSGVPKWVLNRLSSRDVPRWLYLVVAVLAALLVVICSVTLISMLTAS
jgi:hypothetical protein